MKGLSTLIKLSKRSLDELRRKVAALEGQKSQMLLLSSRLQEELQREMDMATSQPEMARFFGDFSKRIKARQEQIAQEVKTLDTQIAKLADEIAVAFGELKKYELALASFKRKEEQKRSRRETVMLDEIAGQQHRRKENESTS